MLHRCKCEAAEVISRRFDAYGSGARVRIAIAIVRVREAVNQRQRLRQHVQATHPRMGHKQDAIARTDELTRDGGS